MARLDRDKLNRMVIFARVVEAQSFSAAARQLGIGKSAVSMQITRLEQQLGVRLLNRTTRQLNLTEAGHQYYQSCALIAEEAARANEQVGKFKHELSGSLRITCPVGFGSRVLAPLLPRFMAQYPELELELNLEDRSVNLVEEAYDLAIRVAYLADSSLVAKPLVSVPLVICGSPAYFERHGIPQSIDVLQQHDWVLFSELPTRLQYEHAGQTYVINPKGRVKVNNEDTRLKLVLAGMGISIIPAYETWEASQAGELQQVLEAYPMPIVPITALYHHRKFLPRKIPVFTDFLKNYLQQQPWVANAG